MRAIAAATMAVFGLAASPQIGVAQAAPAVETILYQAADALGMLRTPREVDRIATLIYTGAGTKQVGGRPCTMQRYQASVRYPIPDARHSFPVPGMRIDFDCINADGEPDRHVEVVAGEFAWNETAPGRNATPAPGTVRERLLQIWMLPQGLIKAAVAAGERTIVSVQSGNPVLTFPLPAPLENSQVAVTFDPAVFLSHTMPNGVVREFSHRITHAQTQLDGVQFAVEYADYQDWNAADYKSDVLLPGRMVQRRNGSAILDLTLIESNTYNPYVVMPVPETIATQHAAAAGR